jgi:membrane-associated phospholipid phosphatase
MRPITIAFLIPLLAVTSTASAQSSDVPLSTRPFLGLFAVGQREGSTALSLGSIQDPAQKPAKPQHTGFAALVRSTASDFNAFPRRKSTWVILAIGAAAAGAAAPTDREVSDELQSNWARRLFRPGRVIGYGWVQTGAAIGTYLVGRYVIKPPEGQTNKISHIGFDLLRANILAQALTYGIKFTVQRDRPTGECCSFPSGHAAVTFAMASVLERHFGGYRGAWPTYLIGGYVAMSRIYEGRHYPSDVLFGSALGIASGWTVVGRHGRSEYTLMPVPTRGGFAVVWTRVREGNP